MTLAPLLEPRQILTTQNAPDFVVEIGKIVNQGWNKTRQKTCTGIPWIRNKKERRMRCAALF
jgi:uncharacterized protein (DUF736 family)